MTAQQLEQRLNWMEHVIANERDLKNLPFHNATYQKLLDRLVALDLSGLNEEPQAAKGKRT